MHRRKLRQLLLRYERTWNGETDIVARFREFIAKHDDCLRRSCVPGHITASAWILAPDNEAVLLTHHRKLERWLQLGGHVDGESRVELAAMREAQEESGMHDFSFVSFGGDGITPLDLDVHPIPAHGREPRHYHWDVRFLLRAGREQQLAISEESNDLRWFEPDEVHRVTDEESVLRLQRKAERLGQT